MDTVVNVFHWGQDVQNQGDLSQAISHYTKALEIFHSTVGAQYNRLFWAKILFAHAEAYLLLGQYRLVEKDVKQALNDCSEQCHDLDKAHLWLNHGSKLDVHPSIAVCCCSAALHFAAGDDHFQSEIYSIRALHQYKLGEQTKCEQDVEECKRLDMGQALKTGLSLKSQGMDSFRSKNHAEAIDLLQRAEIFFRPPYPHPVDNSPGHHWYDCWRYIIITAWQGELYMKAVEAGKKWRQTELITNEKDAVGWKERGNEMFKKENYDLAIDCYTLSIQYAPAQDMQLGTLYSNRSYAYFKKEHFKDAKEDAEKSLKHRPDWSKGFYRLGSALMALEQYDRALEILKNGLHTTGAQEQKYEIFKKIMTLVFNTEDGLTKVTFELPRDCLSKYLKEHAEKHDWKPLEVLLLGGGGYCSYAKGKGGIATGSCDLQEISLCNVIESKPKLNMYYELINAMLDHGALVDGCNKQSTPLAIAVNYDDHDLAVALLKKNANPDGLLKSRFGKKYDTAIHTAFRIGLSLGHWQIFVHLIENSGYSMNNSKSCAATLDKKGNSLYHLVASREVIWPHTLDGIYHLRKYKVDPRRKNMDGDTPLIALRYNSDLRYRFIKESVESFSTDNHQKKKTQKQKTKKSKKVDPPTSSKGEKNKNENQIKASPEEVLSPHVHHRTEIEILREKISEAIGQLVVENANEIEESKEETREIDQDFSSSSHGTIPRKGEELVVKTLTSEDHVAENKHPIPTAKKNIGPRKSEEVFDDVFDNGVCGAFNNLTWEVECTSDVLKTLSDKKLPSDKKRKIVRIITQLANGDMRGSHAKRVTAKESEMLLFEAKLDKSARILWEKAIAFSPRYSCVSDNNDNKSCEIYTEVIRIWNIVFDHDALAKKIKQIVRSYNRGTSCFVRKNLKGSPLNNPLVSTKNVQKSTPKIYLPKEDAAQQIVGNTKPCTSNDECSKIFFPPGSPEETEYHILKFYAFSNAMVNAMLDRSATNFDFPFRVSELEHSIINLAPKRAKSILLLGRSGTGKTTCCLYRLWTNYQTYWKKNTLDQPIPNIAQSIPQESNDSTDAMNGKGEHETSACEEGCAWLRKSIQDNGDCSRSTHYASSVELLGPDEETRKDENQEPSCPGDKSEEEQAVRNEPIPEHLHQVFVTKNAVLCKEVEKSFTQLRRALFSEREDLYYQHCSSIFRFDQLDEHSWPLFISSRHWLLMLDASLPGKPFFARNEDGKLERNISGWDEDDKNLLEIPVDYSYDEPEDHEEIRSTSRAATGDRKIKVEQDPRREITYHVLKNELWGEITKKKKVDYHPSLVWTEIISFIKGSVEALHSEKGCITLEEYQTMGNKRAPSFTADRETIYELFLAYERIKHTLGMFDEADVVHQIYRRLVHHVPAWFIHEIYVDETQDFTQAELSVIIRSCRNPNGLFFTGDTAQSIMRGIAFRFSDLRSLFHYMKESVKSVSLKPEVRVPDRVYQLTHNYRSHAGILNMASSVIDLLSYFFPESFDKLARDQGLFEGPKPVLLESCCFSDLAEIPGGHKRKTSKIEFGADQAILVASNEVKDSLKKELNRALVLTIFEAKGLEFDDVLIYNFFKDSQALKEWRVVGTYKGNQNENTNVGATGIAEIKVDSLECKARPLEFNPDQHKILVLEFKYLYTAITRARAKVWLFDESEEARAPMFEYFQKREVVVLEDNIVSLEGKFAQKSEESEWKEKGHSFYSKRLWNAASQCFTMANEELWVKKCHAHEQVAKAETLSNDPLKSQLEFAKAADLFLQCNMKNAAEKCLFHARERILLAKLHEKSNNFLKAARIFEQERVADEAARNFENAGYFDRAADCLLQANHYNEVLDLISRYNDLIRLGQGHTILKHLRFDQTDESICYQAAEFYKRHDHHLMTAALQKLPNVEDRITFLQRNGFFDQAAEVLIEEGEAQEAAKLMRLNGEFLEAAMYSKDDKFIADCYLLTARLTVKEEILNKDTEKYFNGLLETATEKYKRCNCFNGQAEVLFARGKILGNSADIDQAGKLYNQVSNYAALTDCFLLLTNTEKDPELHLKAKITLRGLFNLILALHKDQKKSDEHTAISMCHAYFGLEDTHDMCTKKVPLHEKVRFVNIENVHAKLNQDGMIPAEDADALIKNHLFQMAHDLIKRLWNMHQEVTKCIHNHAELNRDRFCRRLQALLFLVSLEETISNFLKRMQRVSPNAKNQLQKKLFIEPEFTACQWLYNLLFSRDGLLVSSQFLTEKDVGSLRCVVSSRIKEFAMFLWYRSSEDERWSSSDHFIKVSNMMHVAGASVENLLSAEERKFKDRNLPSHPGVFRRESHGRFEIFSKSLERSKSKLYQDSDVIGSIHAAVREFLFTPAKRPLSYPSIANAVMILERQLTACLILHSRLKMSIVCLPESYLSMIKFWDLVERSEGGNPTLYSAIQGSATQRGFNHLQGLATDMVKLTFGKVSREYDIVSDALFYNPVNCVEAERVLVLVLTMLCNCGRGIPIECEKLIRDHLLTLQLRQDLPNNLQTCFKHVCNATGFRGVVLCLNELLNQKPRPEKLFDVKWDDLNVKPSRRDCKTNTYSIHFEIDANTPSKEIAWEGHDERHESTETTDEMNANFSHVFNEDKTNKQPQEYDDEAKAMALSVIKRALLKWKSRKEAKAKFDEKIKNDSVEYRFQSFRLDKSGCTICGHVLFVDQRLSATNTCTVSSDQSSPTHQEEETMSTWELLQQNTFENHCSKGSPHWLKEKALQKFKEIYRKRICPTIERATVLKGEMTKLNEDTKVNCDFDLHRLDNTLNRLHTAVKKVEDQRSWDSVHFIEQAVKQENIKIREINKRKSKKGPLKAVEHAVGPDSGDEIDGNNEVEVDRLKDVNKVKSGTRKARPSSRRK